jgi:tungstate transport system substrate-binding protein
VNIVNTIYHPKVKKAEGQAFIDWIVSKEGQESIASYQVAGEQSFFPNAK